MYQVSKALSTGILVYPQEGIVCDIIIQSVQMRQRLKTALKFMCLGIVLIMFEIGEHVRQSNQKPDYPAWGSGRDVDLSQKGLCSVDEPLN